MKLAYDDNLGISAGLADHVSFESQPFHEIGEQIDEFEAGNHDVSFLPAGTLPYIDCDYDIVGEVTRGSQRDIHLKSVLVELADNSDSTTPVYERRIGHVNKYCTTSYWAPMISLLDQAPAGKQLNFIDSRSFDDLLASVIDGRAEISMVWDAVLEEHPDEQSLTKELISKSDLPGPLLLVRQDWGASDRAALEAAIPCQAEHSGEFFNGLTTPNHRAIETFKQQMAAAKAHFSL